MNSRLRNSALTALAAALLALCAQQGVGALAQVTENQARVAAHAKEAGPPRARKIDEFGRLYGCDGGDSAGSYNIGVTYAAFRELLGRQPDSQGYVVVYTRRETYPGYWRSVATREREKLAGNGFGAERLTIIRGGVNEGDVKGFQGEDEDRLEQFDRVELWVGAKDKPPVRHRPEKQTLEEAVLVAHIPNYFSDDERINRWALDNLFESARANPRSTACIIIFPGEHVVTSSDGERPVDMFKVAGALKAELRKRGVDETRIVLMNGPAEESSGRLELWAVPYGAALPDPFAVEDVEAESEESEPEGKNPRR